MSDEADAPVGGEAVTYALPADAPAEMNVSEAARLFSQSKSKPEPAESAKPATAEEPELAEQAEADPETDPGETTEEAQQADEPPIERPRSWAKELDEEWASYPREAQERIVAREQERDAAIRRSQNEAAETRKAAEALQAQAEQARKTYEAKLPEVERYIQDFISTQYPDIKTYADVEKMAMEDPFRKIQWDTHQQKIAGVMREAQEAKFRQENDRRSSWAQFVQKESVAFSEDTPEFKAKETEYTKQAREVLTELGFTNEELAKLASGDEKIALYDRRLQRLLFDRIRLSEIKAAPAKAAPKALPPVQKPGVAKGGNPSSTTQIKALETQLSTATGTQALRVAAQLTALKRASAR